jgi:glycosyltransferase involved in cell wall biosynthesis
MNIPKISIITVVFNSEKFIERTLQSVFSQTYRNIEYIIIDGGSKDKTLEIIQHYSNKVAILISEPDKGLYDAMNKGLFKATGDYVCFLNSGDILYSSNTLEDIFGKLDYLPDVVYGETTIIDTDGNELGLRRLKAPEQLTWESFKDGMLVCHQSVYVKRSIAEPYNLKYKISADYEWVLKALKKATTIYNSRLIHTRFMDGGINKKNIRRGLTERMKVMIKHYGIIPTLFKHLIIGVKFFVYYFKNKRF